MNASSSTRKFNYPHAVLVAGLVLSLLAVMFRPAGADAGTPRTVDVFSAWDEDVPSSVEIDSTLPTVTRKYDVILKGKTKSTEVELTGIKLSELLAKVDAKTDNVQFVKIRYGTKDDGIISLVSLNADSPERPPILLTAGTKPGRGPFATPAIVPGQPGSAPIKESSFVPFSAGKGDEPIKIIPGKPGGKILSVKLDKTVTSKKQIKYTPVILNGTKNAARKVQWFEYTEKGKIINRGTSSTFTTDNATSGTAQHIISAVVTETISGSTGAGTANYTSQKADKGSTKDPYPKADPTPSTGGNTGSGNTGTGNGVTQNGTGSSSTVPNFNSLQPTSPTTQPDQTQQALPEPSAPTSAQASPAVDTSAITNTAQNVSGTGSPQTVTGVLLSAPTTAPISDAGTAGTTALTVLPTPVATELERIFQPVDDAEDLWAYLLAILFAFSISGAVREWVNP